MKKKVSATPVVILIVFAGLFALNCADRKNNLSVTNKTSQPVQNLTGEELSRLDIGKIVRFPATVVNSSENGCVELFAQDEYQKYNGDSKFAIRSKFAAESKPDQRFWGSKNAIVTGKMNFVKDSTDTDKTCGINTGHIFEITEIEYF
jgi:hypothetical protein